MQATLARISYMLGQSEETRERQAYEESIDKPAKLSFRRNVCALAAYKIRE